MITPEVIVKIRHLFFAEHWTIGTIASQLGLHRDTVRAAIETEGFNRARRERANRLTDPYLDFVRHTLKSQHEGTAGRGRSRRPSIKRPASFQPRSRKI